MTSNEDADELLTWETVNSPPHAISILRYRAYKQNRHYSITQNDDRWQLLLTDVRVLDPLTNEQRGRGSVRSAEYLTADDAKAAAEEWERSARG